MLRSILGFTLIELLVVLVIVSLLAVAVVLSSTSLWRQASIESTLVRLESLDQHMRSFARSRNTPCKLEFDTFSQQARKVYDQRHDQTATQLGRGLKLQRVRLPGVASTRRKVIVPFDGGGISPTYALEFQAGPQKFWLLFAGVSGQSTRFDSEKELNAAFQLISP